MSRDMHIPWRSFAAHSLNLEHARAQMNFVAHSLDPVEIVRAAVFKNIVQTLTTARAGIAGSGRVGGSV